MEIATTPPNTTLPSTATSPSDAATLNSDFETFLKMLTTQMQNQDPLNPVDSADFGMQLATFSSVEQQVLTNDLLTALGAQVGTLGIAQLSGWVGMNARAQMPVAFDGTTPVTVTGTAAAGADTAELVARNTLGVVVSRQDVSAESGPVVWNGVNTSGQPLPAGSYTVEFVSFANGEEIGTQQVELLDRIVEARSESGQTILVMAGGQHVAAADILSLSAPSPVEP